MLDFQAVLKIVAAHERSTSAASHGMNLNACLRLSALWPNLAQY